MRAHMLARAHAHHHHRPGTIACTIPPIIAAKDMHMTIHPAFTYRPFFNIFRKKKTPLFNRVYKWICLRKGKAIASVQYTSAVWRSGVYMNRSTRHAAFKPVQIVRVARFSVQSEACPVARMTNARCDKCTVLGGRIDDRLECIDEISSILHDCCLFNATAFGVVLFPNMARHLQIVIHLPGVES